MSPPFPILFSSDCLHKISITRTKSLTVFLVLCSRELSQGVCQV